MKLNHPFVLITIFFVLFIYLRYFFVIYDWSGLVSSTNQYVNSTLIIYFLLHFVFGILCLLIIGSRWKTITQINTSTTPIVKIYLWLGIFSLVLLSLITLKNHGTIGWFVPSWANHWQSLYILEIPINFIQIIFIHFLFNSKSRIQKFQLLLLLLLYIFLIGSRGAIATLFVYIILYSSVFNRTVSMTKIIIFLVLIFPITITFLTFLKFRDKNIFESASIVLPMLIDKEFWVWFFSVAYGRYYILETSILMLERIQQFHTFEYQFFTYLFNNFVPSFLNPDKISITRLNCDLIAPGRWEETVSCSISFPFFLYIDSYVLGLIYFIIMTCILLFFWKLLNNAKDIFSKLIYVFFLPQFMFFLNWDAASINYIMYQFLYFSPGLFLYILSITSKAKQRSG